MEKLRRKDRAVNEFVAQGKEGHDVQIAGIFFVSASRRSGVSTSRGGSLRARASACVFLCVRIITGLIRIFHATFFTRGDGSVETLRTEHVQCLSFLLAFASHRDRNDFITRA